LFAQADWRSSIAPHGVQVPRASFKMAIKRLHDLEHATYVLKGQWNLFVNGERLGALDGILDLFDSSVLVQKPRTTTLGFK
jgi:hypothetical protein